MNSKISCYGLAELIGINFDIECNRHLKNVTMCNLILI